MSNSVSHTKRSLPQEDLKHSESVKRRRPRGVIVCKNCRRRKIKCDKQRPCTNCVRFDQADSCFYEAQQVSQKREGYLEIQLPMKFSSKPINSQSRPTKIKQKKDLEPDHSTDSRYDLGPKDAAVPNGENEGERSELQILKERIQQIERSLQSNRPNFVPPHAESRSTLRQSQGFSEEQAFLNLPTIPTSISSSSPPPLNSLKQEQTWMTNSMSSTVLPSTSLTLDSPRGSSISSLPPLSHHFTQYDDGIKRARVPSFRQQGSIGSKFMTGPSDASQLKIESYPEMFALPKLPDIIPHSSNNAPFLIGHNIYSHESDTINFFEGYSSIHYKDHLRRLNFGPFAWSSLMKRDVGLRTVWDHVVSNKEKALNKGHSAALMFAHPTADISDENTETLFTSEKDNDQLEKQFERRALQTDGLDDMIPYKKLIQVQQNTHKQKELLNKHALPLGLTVFDGKLDRELQLIEKIEIVLPKKRVLWKLIHRFFRSMYTYMPFIDEDCFRADLERIIGQQSFDDVSIEHVKIERKLDLATVGILLIILRLAYLSLFSNNSSLNESILNDPSPSMENGLVQYLMKNPININTIDVASLCLDQFQILRRSNFTVLQLALFLRLYHTYAPEDGDGADGGDSQVLNSVLIQTAYSLGMNREPDEREPYTDPKMNHLTRKIWKFLLASDAHLSYSFGNPLAIDINNFDIKDPVCEPGSENLRDKEKDRATTARLNWCALLTPNLREILQCALNIRGRVELPKLCQAISDLEFNLHNNVGSLGSFIVCTGMDELEIANRNMKVKSYLAVKSFLISIFFHLYLHYEGKDTNVSYFYLKKSLLTTIGDIMPHYVTLLGESEVISDMIINPTLEMTIHKSNQINLSIIVRVNFVIFHLKQSKDHERLCKNDLSYFNYFQLLCQLSSAVTRAAEFTISAISKLSNRYYYAWRITRGQTYLLKTITLTQFYEDNYHKATAIYSTRYSSEQIKELIAICEKTLSEFSHTEFCTYGFARHMDRDLYKCNETPTGSLASSASTTLSEPKRNSTNAEIDKIWLQVLSLKHNTNLAGNLQETPLDSKALVPLAWALEDLTHQADENDGGSLSGSFGRVDRTGYDMEMANRVDFFSEMPFEGMLDL